MHPVSRYFIEMLNRPSTLNLIPTLPEQTTLPKLIHQTFPPGPLPPEIRSNIDRLKALNPTWEHKLYSDQDIEEFIEKTYGERILRRYRKINPLYGAARADLFRYLLLYKVGGLYLDIKSSASRPLDSVLLGSDRYLISQWRNGPGEVFEFAGLHEDVEHIPRGEFQQWFVCATAGHPFLKAVLENVLRNIDVYNPALHGVGKPAVLRVTGPIAYTLAIAPILDKHPHRRIRSEVDIGFEYTIYPTDALRHMSLFKVHYSLARQSLIELSRSAAMVTGLLFATKRCVRWMLGRQGQST